MRRCPRYRPPLRRHVLPGIRDVLAGGPGRHPGRRSHGDSQHHVVCGGRRPHRPRAAPPASDGRRRRRRRPWVRWASPCMTADRCGPIWTSSPSPSSCSSHHWPRSPIRHGGPDRWMPVAPHDDPSPAGLDRPRRAPRRDRYRMRRYAGLQHRSTAHPAAAGRRARGLARTHVGTGGHGRRRRAQRHRGWPSTRPPGPSPSVRWEERTCSTSRGATWLTVHLPSAPRHIALAGAGRAIPHPRRGVLRGGLRRRARAGRSPHSFPPDACPTIWWTPDGTVFVGNEHDSTMTVIRQQRVIATVPVAEQPGGLDGDGG